MNPVILSPFLPSPLSCHISGFLLSSLPCNLCIIPIFRLSLLPPAAALFLHLIARNGGRFGGQIGAIQYSSIQAELLIRHIHPKPALIDLMVWERGGLRDSTFSKVCSFIRVNVGVCHRLVHIFDTHDLVLYVLLFVSFRAPAAKNSFVLLHMSLVVLKNSLNCFIFRKI